MIPRDRIRDAATSPVVGVLLMLPVAVTLALSLMLYLDAYSANVDAKRRAAEKAAWCSRHPDRTWPGEGSCPSLGPRGYDCANARAFPEVLKCVPVDGDEDPGNYTVIRNTDPAQVEVRTR